MGLKKATLQLWVYTGLFDGPNKTVEPVYNKQVHKDWRYYNIF